MGGKLTFRAESTWFLRGGRRKCINNGWILDSEEFTIGRLSNIFHCKYIQTLGVFFKNCTSSKLARLLDTVSKFPLFSVFGLKDEKLIKKLTYSLYVHTNWSIQTLFWSILNIFAKWHQNRSLQFRAIPSDVKSSRPQWPQSQNFGLGIGLGLGLEVLASAWLRSRCFIM